MSNTEALPPLPETLALLLNHLRQWRRAGIDDEAIQAGDEALRAALAQRQQAPTTAWLVEWRFNGVQWLYLWPSAPGGFSFTSDASKALRFARREDAEAALQWARDTDAARRPIGSLTRHGLALGEMLVTEHDWPAIPASPSAQVRAKGPLRSLTDEQCDAIYENLHEYAISVDKYYFGLPLPEGDAREKIRAIIRENLK